MRTFNDIPIKQKLMIIIMVTTSVALLSTGIGIVVADSRIHRDYLERDLNGLSKMIADNSTAALAFNDQRVATETLTALKAKSHMVAACTYTLAGRLFAQYHRHNSMPWCPPLESQVEVKFSNADLNVSHAIILDNRRIGTLILVYDLQEISERVKLYGGTVFGVVLVAALIAFLLSSKLSSLIERPIAQLVSATTSVNETTNYGIRAQKFSGDELGVLVDRFNEMLAGIQSRDDSLTKALRDREVALRDTEEAKERFRFMAESMPQKIFTALPNGELNYFNGQWFEYTGLSLAQLQFWSWTQFIHDGDLEEHKQSWMKSIQTGEPFHLEHRFRRADGAYHWHLSRAHAMYDAAGNVLMWIGSSTNIHEQKLKEEQLRRANDDLQQFAYSASHDLQEPIRNVAVYSEIISRQYSSVLDAEGQQFLGFLTEGSRRLATLINDLLDYTRAGAEPGVMTTVDSNEVLKVTLTSLAQAVSEAKATVTHDRLPNVYIGEAHLQQVFINLISNALKYRSDNSPLVHVSAVHQSSRWIFSVRDNGIGIDTQYKEKIFGVFKRLHRDQKYSGTGIGLAICQRVVERYGGRIWVEPEPGKGSIFYFTVPDQAREFRSPSSETLAR